MKAFVDAMASRGHKVTVICEFPNHPTGILSKRDRWRLFRVEKKDNYTVIRTFVLAFRKKNNMKRMLFYMSFAFSSFLAGVFVKRHDIVFSSSPPIFHVLSALFISKLKRSKFVLDIRDIWPDTALYFEAVTSQRLLKWGRVVEHKLYNDAELIFTVSSGLHGTISSRGAKGKVYISYNGSDEDMLEWSGDAGKMRENLGWSDKFVVVYAGLMGLGQKLTSLPDHIKQIDDSSVKFVFIGDGPEKSVLMEQAGEMRLSNMTFFELMPREQVTAYMHSADALLVILREADFFKSAIPSKFFDCMAAGKPVISNVDGELRNLMEQHGTGIYFSLDKAGSFGKAITILKNDPELRKRMGENGRRLVKDNFLRAHISDMTVKRIEDCLATLSPE
jgi:glycosyltransferase involved in cell wall biosynthesis